MNDNTPETMENINNAKIKLVYRGTLETRENEESIALISAFSQRIGNLESRNDQLECKNDELENKIDELINKLGGKNEEKDDDDEEEDERESVPESSTSFLMLAKYPFFKQKKNYNENTVQEDEEAAQDNGSTMLGSFLCLPTDKNSQDFLCLPFFLSVMVLVVQVMIYTMIFLGIVDISEELKEIFKFPMNVDPNTRVAALLAIALTVYTQSDFLDGVGLFIQGFNSLKGVPGSAIGKYYTAATIQLLIGIYGIFVTFLLIVQSYDVVNLLLNFAAVEFVSQLDETVFFLAQKGFLGKPARKTAEVIANSKFTVVKKGRWYWLKKLPHPLLFISLFIPYIIIFVWQNDRKFGDNDVNIQIDDGINPLFGTLSGVYHGCTLTFGDRYKLGNIGPVVYTPMEIGEREKCFERMETSRASFFYCKKQRAWVLSLLKRENSDYNPCNKDFDQGLLLESFNPDSAEPDAFDILRHSSAIWYAYEKNNERLVNMVAMKKYINEETSQLPNSVVLRPTDLAFNQPFYKMLGKDISRHPVFYNLGNLRDKSDGEFIFFNGLRWILMKESATGIDECKADNTTDECIAEEFQKANFHPYDSNYTAEFISEPMILDTASDTFIPTEELRWFRAQSKSNKGKETEPDANEKSLFEKVSHEIDVIDKVSKIRDTLEPKLEEEVRNIFLDSSRLKKCENCECNADEKLLWLEFVTDTHPEENEVFIQKWDDQDLNQNILDENKLDESNLDETGMGHFDSNFMNFFDIKLIHSSKESTEENKFRLFPYKTCMKPESCVLVSLKDAFLDGIYAPGSFKVYYDGGLLFNSRKENKQQKWRYLLCIVGDKNKCRKHEEHWIEFPGKTNCYYTNELLPTIFHSDVPSVVPSAAPSKSILPSTTPSVAPSAAPSVAPSVAPSSDPSNIPSTVPSTPPSDSPFPSDTPSTLPSAAPVPLWPVW